MINTVTINTNFEWISEFDAIFFGLMGLFDPAVSRTRVHVKCRGVIIGTRWI
jgi:hypothetical protein